MVVRRRGLILFVIGWLFGLLTVVIGPDLVQERTSLALPESRVLPTLSSHFNAGYTLERTQHVTGQLPHE